MSDYIWCENCGNSGWVTLGTCEMVEFTSPMDNKEYVAEDWNNHGDVVCNCKCEKARRLRTSIEIQPRHYLENVKLGKLKIRKRPDPRKEAAEEYRRQEMEKLTESVVPF